MGCFSHIKKQRKRLLGSKLQSIQPASSANEVKVRRELKVKTREEAKEVVCENDHRLGSNINKGVCSEAKAKEEVRTFTFHELAEATGNFKSDCFLGEGGFGKVYKGHLRRINKLVAIKQLDRSRGQGIREFMVEVVTLSLANDPNLVKLIGYCVEGDQRLLVYEFMPLGSLDRHLHGYWAKLSDFGLAKVGPSGDNTHVSTRVMGTYGYCAPDYAMTGQLTFKSDIYSFGVVLLELITGRKAIDHTRPSNELSLVAWARPLYRDRKRFIVMADPRLDGQFPIRGLYQALAIAAMCLQEHPTMRPSISEVVAALNFLASRKYPQRTSD